MSRSRIRTLQTAAALLSLLGSCVKKSEYDALQMENQALQTRVDETSHLLEQSQADVTLLRGQLQHLLTVQTQLQETQQELKRSHDEFTALKAQFDQFRTQRRSAMVGKKFPLLNLDDGKVLREAEIMVASADELSIRHAGGVVKVALAKTTPDLRWEACYDPLEAKEKSRQKMLAKAREMEAAQDREQDGPLSTPASASVMPAQYVGDVLRAQLASQRKALNAEYQAMVARNPGALRGVAWDSSRPETSPLLSSLSGSRAVLGISRLQSYRTAILATLQQLRDVDPAAR